MTSAGGVPENRSPRPPERTLRPDDFATWMWHVVRTATLTTIQKALILLVATYDWPTKGEGCFASIETLAAAMPCDRKTVIRNIQTLHKRGLLTKRPQSTRTGRRPNLLTVNRKACADLPVSQPSTNGCTQAQQSTATGTQATQLSTGDGTSKVPPVVPSKVPPEGLEERSSEGRAVKNVQALSEGTTGGASTAACPGPGEKAKGTADQRVVPFDDGVRKAMKVNRVTPEEDAQVRTVHAFWQKTCHREHPLTPKRYGCTLRRLREEYSVEQLQEAVTNASRNAWAQGANAGGCRWDDLVQLFKDAETVDRWLAKPTMVDRTTASRQVLNDPSLSARRAGDPPRTTRRL